MTLLRKSKSGRIGRDFTIAPLVIVVSLILGFIAPDFLLASG
jgi:hypothetical protein